MLIIKFLIPTLYLFTAVDQLRACTVDNKYHVSMVSIFVKNVHLSNLWKKFIDDSLLGFVS